ncbi:MAG: BatD family protein [Candidatus Omnitrophica bacterium]|nr:BatD family protein [Candidatus Omnitrophota bacterium]
MKRTLLCTVVFVFMLYRALYAQTSIQAEVDKTEVAIDGQLTYTLTIISTEKEVPLPVISKFSGFKIISQVSSSSFSFDKDVRKSTVIYAFALKPRKAGIFVIGPSIVRVGKEALATRSFVIEVVAQKQQADKKAGHKEEYKELPATAPRI